MLLVRRENSLGLSLERMMNWIGLMSRWMGDGDK